MAYRLVKAQSPGSNIRRIAREQLQAAQRDLRKTSAMQLQESVHSARKRLKRLRSMLRLARRGLKGKRYRQIDHAVRDVGRTLAATRDRHIILATGRSITRPDGPARHRRGPGWPTTQPQPADRKASVEARRQITRLLNQVERWPVTDVSRDDLERGARRRERRCRKARRAAARKPSAANMHEWRKCVKDMQHILELRGQSGSDRYRSIKELAQVLGDYHDLDVLSDSLRKRRQHSRAVRSRIRKKQAALCSNAFELKV